MAAKAEGVFCARTCFDAKTLVTRSGAFAIVYRPLCSPALGHHPVLSVLARRHAQLNAILNHPQVEPSSILSYPTNVRRQPHHGSYHRRTTA